MKPFRTETDSMGEMQVPADALYGAQTARALENFPISSLGFPRRCVVGLQADEVRCKSNLEQRTALCAALAPVIGYDHAARIAKVAGNGAGNLPKK